VSVRERVEVLIVGAGPIGLTAANVIGRAGVRTLLIERNAGLSEHPKALNVDDEFFRLLTTLGLGDRLAEHGIGPIDFEYRSPLGFRVGYVTGRTTEHNHPNRTATFQPTFERILHGGATRYGTVAVRFGHELLALAQTGAGVVATVRTAEGATHEIEAAYLVAADGGRSTVRKLLEIPFDPVGNYNQGHVVVDVADDETHDTIGLTQLGFRRNVMSLPLPGGRRYEFSVREGEDEAALMERAALRRILAPYVDLDRVRILRTVAYTFRARLARRFGQGRVFLIGDAAHLMPVFGSQGMNSGARDAINLGWKLAAVLTGRAAPGILATYEEERRPQVADTITMALRNGRLQSVRHLPATLARDLLMAVLGLIPPVRRFIRDMRYVPPNATRSELVLGTGGALGLPLPNPSLWSGGTLDGVLGPGFALVAVGRTTLPGAAGLDHPLWRRLGAQVVAVLPAAGGPESGPGAPAVVRVADERLHRVFESDPDRWLLVRPDRIVAASVPFGELAALGDLYAGRLGLPADAEAVAA
jgi:3-(3-hydroxy-phenyl)propionate hydroxylase